MKERMLFIGLMSLALAGCGGGANSANVAEPIVETNANTAPSAINVAEITDPNAALAEGNRLMDENQTEPAIAAYQRAIELNPDLAEAHFRLGIAYALLDMEREQAGIVVEPESNASSKQPPKKTESEKAFEEAVRAYKKWLDANPKDDSAHYYLGRTYAKLMKDEEAKESFEEAVKLKPDDTEYQTELGAILIKLAEYHAAIKPLKKAIELDSANGRAFDLLEEAEAGRRRVDYVSTNKNGNTAVAKKGDANANAANANSASGEGPDQKPADNTRLKKPEPDPKGKKPDPKEVRPRPVPTRPN